MPCHRLLPLAILAFIPLSARAEAPAERPDKAALDALFKHALEQWHAPGMAVVLIQGDEVIYLKGFGVRENGKEQPVTPDTVFGIGSLTKAFTATTLGILVAEGKAKWDDPVRKHVPFFHLADPLADREVTLRDLLCHRTGLGRNDLLWYRAPWSIEDSVRRAALLEPAHSFRATYEYCNVTYIAAGLAVTAAAGEPWPDFMAKRLFTPLEMKRVVLTRSEALKLEDHATPHHFGPAGLPETMPWYPDDKQIRGSGSIKTCVRDLGNWVRMQLNDGTFGGKRVVPSAILAETHKPQVVVAVPAALAKLAGTTLAGYGLGWHISDYRGQPLLEHGGAVDGFRARIMLLPKQKLGAVLLTNVEESAVLSATGNQLLDLLLGSDAKVDWHAHYAREVKSAQKARMARAEERQKAKRPGTKPSHSLETFAGEYEDPAYGPLKITLEDGALHLIWSGWKAKLTHYHFDTFETHGPERLDGELLAFALKSDGTVGKVRFLGREFQRAK